MSSPSWSQLSSSSLLLAFILCFKTFMTIPGGRRGPVVRALNLHALESRSSLWLGFVSGYPVFNSLTLCKSPTGYLLPVGVLNHVSVKFKLFLSGC